MSDYAKRKQRETERVIEQVKTKGGFSAFWITETAIRARVADELINSGKIKPKRGYNTYPWQSYKLIG